MIINIGIINIIISIVIIMIDVDDVNKTWQAILPRTHLKQKTRSQQKCLRKFQTTKKTTVQNSNIFSYIHVYYRKLLQNIS